MFDASRSLPRPTRLQRLITACGLVLAAGMAQGQALPQAPAPSASQPAGDAVSRFLQERGLLAPLSGLGSSGNNNEGLLDQVRDKASDLVLASMNFLGVPYRRGGNSAESGFDCSGFTRHIFELSVGLVLPRRADEQAKLSSLVPIKKDELKPGDLVFFNTMRRTFSHVGIYVGEGKFIHAPRSGSKVRVEDMREAYWAKRFTGARRADLNAADKGGSAATALN
jgi:cell wall-associated NlpC family hydrolase